MNPHPEAFVGRGINKPYVYMPIWVSVHGLQEPRWNEQIANFNRGTLLLLFLGSLIQITQLINVQWVNDSMSNCCSKLWVSDKNWEVQISRHNLTLILCACSSYTDNYIGMQGVVEESSKVKAPLFAPGVSQSITPMSLILLAEPKEREAGVESTGTTATKTRKLPQGTDPPGMKQLSKRFGILSNSGLVNILNLTCKHDWSVRSFSCSPQLC